MGQLLPVQPVIYATIDQERSAIEGTNNGNGAGISGTNTGTGPGVYGLATGSTSGNGVLGIAATNTPDSNGGYFTSISPLGSPGGLLACGAPGVSGGYAAYAGRGTYGPFTAGHDAFILKANDIKDGEIVIDVKVIARNGSNDTITEIQKSNLRGDVRAAGVMTKRMSFDPDGPLAAMPKTEKLRRKKLAKEYDRITMNALGEGQMLVCGRGGDIESGDYIWSSDLPGKGERQNTQNGSADDFLRRATVAQAREPVSFLRPDEVKMIAVFYRCG